MNFKPTLWKSIVSIITGIMGYIFINAREIREYRVNGTGVVEYILNPSLIEPFLYILIPITLVFLIWSFIQKK